MLIVILALQRRKKRRSILQSEPDSETDNNETEVNEEEATNETEDSEKGSTTSTATASTATANTSNNTTTSSNTSEQPVAPTTKTFVGDYITITIPTAWNAEEIHERPTYGDVGLIEFNLYNAAGTKVFGLYAPEALGWGGNECSDFGTYKAFSDYNPASYQSYVDFFTASCTGEPAALEFISYQTETSFLGYRIRRTSGVYRMDSIKGDQYFSEGRESGLPITYNLQSTGISYFLGGTYKEYIYTITFNPTASDYTQLETALATAVISQ
ncbi:hypothetical protein JW962_03040 [Candidatus Dojkabacteria bacterium]|nr:hypothetical protein [Candidatus Dojkabacteria bacterium]